MIEGSTESLGGGVKTEDIVEDREFKDLATMSSAEIEKMLSSPPKEVTISTPDDPQDPPAASSERATDGDSPVPTTDEEIEAELSKLMGADAKPKDTGTVPRAALDAAREKGRESKEELERLRNENAYLKGQTDALRSISAPQTQPLQQQPAPETIDPDELLGNVDKALLMVEEEYRRSEIALAEQYDDTQLSLTEYTKKKHELTDKYRSDVNKLSTARDDILRFKSQPDPETARERINTDPWLKANTDALKTQNPWLEQIPQKMMDDMAERAISEMQRRGIPVESTPESTWQMRLIIAEIGKHWGLDSTFLAPKTPGVKPSVQPTSEQRLSKLELAHTMPPSLSSVGVPGVENSNSPSAISDMTAEQLGRTLPQKEFDRLLNLSS